MPEVVYPSELEVDGPILIGADALEELDKTISEALPKIAETQVQLLPELVNKRSRSVQLTGSFDSLNRADT
jgi:hypothetical protein